MIVLFKFRKSPGQFQWNLNGKPRQLYVPITKKLKKNLYSTLFWVFFKTKLSCITNITLLYKSFFYTQL